MWSPSSQRAVPRAVPGAAALLVLALLLAGCGYRFPGGGAFPAGIRSVHLAAEPADTPLARALNDALRRDATVELAGAPEGADGVLRVKGGEVTSRAAAIDRSGVATEYEVRLRADFRLVKRTPEGEEAVRGREGLEARSTYPYQGDTNPAAEEANRRRAGQQAAEKLADRILAAIRQDF